MGGQSLQSLSMVDLCFQREGEALSWPSKLCFGQAEGERIGQKQFVVVEERRRGR